jgi:putative transposase
MRVLLDECVSEGLRNYLPGHECHFSTVFAGQAVGIKEVHDDIWLVSFMDYDLGYFDLETRVLEPLENPFGPKALPMS